MNKKNYPKAFVIGCPVSHSLSPGLHTYWLQYHGINGSYEKVEVSSMELDVFLNDLSNGKFIGGNVTLPHKEKVYEKIIAANRSKTANKLKAINTLWHENGDLKAGNTDGYGFTANLDNFSSSWRKAGTALVLGAGGVARAVVFALINTGFKKIFIANRTLSKAQSLANEMGNQCNVCSFDDLPKVLPVINLLVNATSLGMKGQPGMDIDLSPLHQMAIVTDTVYNPLQTELLAQADSLNLTTIDGLGMLLHQAAPGFEKWFGVRPQVTTDLRDHVLRCLQASRP